MSKTFSVLWKVVPIAALQTIVETYLLCEAEKILRMIVKKGMGEKHTKKPVFQMQDDFHVFFLSIFLLLHSTETTTSAKQQKL